MDDADHAATADESTNGFYVYTHAKVGADHRLVLANGGDYIVFLATAGYNVSDTFRVNDTVCTATLMNGAALPEGAFVSGVTVICFKSGACLTFVGSIPGDAVLSLSKGGTGATTAAGARANLEVLKTVVVSDTPGSEANTLYFVY